MKKQWLKKLTALVCGALMLCSLCAVGVSADNGLEILAGKDSLYLPFGTVFYPGCSSIPDGVDESTLVWTVGDETIAKYIEATEYSDGHYQAIAAGETTLTVSTPDGAYTDTIALVIQPAIEMKGDTTPVYINHTYMARTFAYTAAQTGYYALDMTLPVIAYASMDVYDADLNMLAYLLGDGDEVYLEANETYYLFVAAQPYDSMSIAFDMTLTYIGGEAAEEPSALVFAEEAITMSLYDVVELPAYSFEPSGGNWYDSVTYSVEENSILTIDGDAMYASEAGTATLTITADSYGWTDTITVTVVDEIKTLTEDAPLAMSVGGAEEIAVLFVAPETKTYTFYSVTETSDDDPLCDVYDAATSARLGYNDDGGEGYNFIVTVDLTAGQAVILALGSYNTESNFTLAVGETVAATGVEIVLDIQAARQGDTMYIYGGYWLYPDVRFLDGPTAVSEEYDIEITSDTAQPDEYGDYRLETGQTATITVTTASGLTDTVTVVAIDALLGDIVIDGEVNLMDALRLFQHMNGRVQADSVMLGAMEINGDNAVSLMDALRLFQYINGQIEGL